MGAEGQDDGDGAGAGGHGEGDGIEQDIIDVPGSRSRLSLLFVPLDVVVGGEQQPAHAADHNAARQLDDWDGQAKQPQDPAADDGRYRANGKTIQRHILCRPFSLREAEIAEKRIDNKGRANRIDGRE